MSDDMTVYDKAAFGAADAFKKVANIPPNREEAAKKKKKADKKKKKTKVKQKQRFTKIPKRQQNFNHLK
jgi:hypothetical protein